MDSRERFSWNDEDVVLKDEQGQVMTPREVLEQQVENLRAQALEEDSPATDE